MSGGGRAPDAEVGSERALTEHELRAWGERLGERVTPPTVIALSGDIGAGKTTLARAICRCYGVTEDVTSPTFAIAHEYGALKSVVHNVDLYRLEGPGDLQNIGWDDLVRDDALLIVEWPERAAGALPTGHMPLELRHIRDDAARRVLVVGAGIPSGL